MQQTSLQPSPAATLPGAQSWAPPSALPRRLQVPFLPLILPAQNDVSFALSEARPLSLVLRKHSDSAGRGWPGTVLQAFLRSLSGLWNPLSSPRGLIPELASLTWVATIFLLDPGLQASVSLNAASGKTPPPACRQALQSSRFASNTLILIYVNLLKFEA